jgi:hypothetical protein
MRVQKEKLVRAVEGRERMSHKSERREKQMPEDSAYTRLSLIEKRMTLVKKQ